MSKNAYSTSSSDDSGSLYAEIGMQRSPSAKEISGYVDFTCEIGRKGKGLGEFGGWIQHFAVSFDGSTLYVCDPWSERIQIFDLQTRKATCEIPSKVVGFPNQPRGIFQLRNGDLCVNCVGYEGISRVCIITPEGRLVTPLKSGINAGSPSAMAVNDMDRISIYDRRRMMVKTWTRDGKLVNQFDTPDIRTDVPRMCADSRGRVLLSDALRDAVRVYDAGGRPVLTIQPRVNCGHELRYPAGVACDHFDNVYVCDVGHNCVSKFSSDGIFQSIVLSRREHQLWQPHDLAITADARLLISQVCDTFITCFRFGKSS